MNFNELKEQYKGITIKPLDENSGNSKGYFSGNDTIYLYKSELTGKSKNSKNGFYIDGNLYLLPAPLKTKLQMHFAKEISEPPAGIDFSEKDERYRIPKSYLQNLTSNIVEQEVPEEIQKDFYLKTDLPQQELTFVTTYSNPSYVEETLNVVAQELQKTRVLDSLPFYIDNLVITKDSLIETLEDHIQYLKEGGKDIIPTIITAILLDKIIKEDEKNDIS